MAELNVERRKRHAWPWILGLLALALIIWAIAQRNDGGNDVARTAPVTTNEAVVPDATAPDATTRDTTATDQPATSSDTPQR